MVGKWDPRMHLYLTNPEIIFDPEVEAQAKKERERLKKGNFDYFRPILTPY